MAKKKDAPSTMESLMDSINSNYGKNTVTSGLHMLGTIPRIPFGVFVADFTSGGGCPVHGTTCAWGQKCLSGDSIISVATVNKQTGKMHSRKDTTLLRFFERFHSIPGGPGRYVRKETVDAEYTVPSVDEFGFVFRNTVTDVVYSGVKDCYQVITSSGNKIKCTMDHQFMLPGGSFKRLSELTVLSKVLIHTNKYYKHGTHYDTRNRREVYVKYHPVWPIKVVNGCVYHRGKVSRAVVEASLNGMSYEEYITVLNTDAVETIDTFTFLPKSHHVHHKNKDVLDNRLENLEVIHGSQHSRDHCFQHPHLLRRIVQEDYIVSITYVGKEDTYDVCCKSPYNNFVANGIVVHNSGGKSSLSVSTAKMASILCWRCFRPSDFCICSESPLRQTAYIGDVEGTLDKEWAFSIGLSPGEFYHGLADHGEQHINIADYALRADDCGLVIIDSLAQLIPEAEMDAPLEDKFMGQQALLITRMVRKLKQRLIRERKRGHPCAVFFVNQLRLKMKVTFGCFHGDTPVMFADGIQFPIKDVVEKRLQGPVLSWDGDKIVERNVTGWHFNGRLGSDEEWLTFQTEGMGSFEGKMGFTCTKDHVLVDGKGKERPAHAFCEGDDLLSWYKEDLSVNAQDMGKESFANRITYPIKIKRIYISKQKMRDKRKYDLTIEGNSFYLVGGDSRGVVVHNSPETMPGGEGLQHEFSLLLRCNKISLKKSTGQPDAKYHDTVRDVDMASRHNVSIYKNKVSVLGNSGEYVRCTENIPELGLRKGQVDDVNTVLSVAKDYGVFGKNGSKYVAGDFYFDKVLDAKNFFTDPANFQAYVDFQQKVIRAAVAKIKGD